MSTSEESQSEGEARDIIEDASKWLEYVQCMLQSTQLAFVVGLMSSVAWSINRMTGIAALLSTPVLLWLIVRANGIAAKRKSLKIRWRKFELLYIFGTEAMLGLVSGCSLAHLVVCMWSWQLDLSTNYSLFLLCTVYYHKGEALFVLNYHPREFTWSSYLIYHSKQYFIAFLSSQIEFFLSAAIVPQLKQTANLATLVVFLPSFFFGATLRHLAFNHAKSNFHHLIRYGRDRNHQLVTTGIYAWERHPSYLGFFVLSISMQAILKNPINTVAFALVLKRFFTERIADEEYTLCQFFGEDYLNYMKAVPSRLSLLFGSR